MAGGVLLSDNYHIPYVSRPEESDPDSESHRNYNETSLFTVSSPPAVPIKEKEVEKEEVKMTQGTIYFHNICRVYVFHAGLKFCWSAPAVCEKCVSSAADSRVEFTVMDGILT